LVNFLRSLPAMCLPLCCGFSSQYTSLLVAVEALFLGGQVLRVNEACLVCLVLMPVAGKRRQELDFSPVPAGAAGEIEDLSFNTVTVVTQHGADLSSHMAVIKTGTVQRLYYPLYQTLLLQVYPAQRAQVLLLDQQALSYCWHFRLCYPSRHQLSPVPSSLHAALVPQTSA